jgi:hypothetical protein
MVTNGQIPLANPTKAVSSNEYQATITIDQDEVHHTVVMPGPHMGDSGPLAVVFVPNRTTFTTHGSGSTWNYTLDHVTGVLRLITNDGGRFQIYSLATLAKRSSEFHRG